MSNVQTLFSHLGLPLIGIILISLVSGLLSPLVVIKQRSYLTDTLAHLILPGVVVGLIMSQVFHIEVWICMMFGAIVTALLGTYLSEWLLKTLKIPSDASAIVCLSAFLALGILILYFTKSDSIDPEALLFGDVLSIKLSNIFVLCVAFVGVACLIGFYRNHWDAWLTDQDFATVMGYKTRFLDKLFPILMTLSVLSGFFAVGGLMIPALMTIPAVFSRPKSAFSYPTIFISLSLSLFGFILANCFNLPIGPVIVLAGMLCIVIRTLFIKKCAQQTPAV